MKAAIYTPYLDTIGGGERYMLSICKVLLSHGWDVYLQGSNEIIKKAEGRFSLGLKNIKMIDDIKRGDGYDLCVWLSDGSIPLLRARKNILHFQRPFFNVDGKSLINRTKFFRINSVWVNSFFTKNWIDREYPIKSQVLYPPVDVGKFRPGKKEKNIVYVGRFSRLEQSKRQDILIDAFKTFIDHFDKTWKLFLIGGSDVGNDGYTKTLKVQAEGYPVEIIENAPFKIVKEIVSKSTFFWSAAGYGVDQNKKPQQLEHFGITIVEAMAAGSIPLAFDAGGHQETIQSEKNGFLWNSVEELLQKTFDIAKDKSKLKQLSQNAVIDSKKFSYENFEKTLLTLI